MQKKKKKKNWKSKFVCNGTKYIYINNWEEELYKKKTEVYEIYEAECYFVIKIYKRGS